MKKTLLLLSLTLAIVLGIRFSNRPANVNALGNHAASASVSITARVDEFAEWDNPEPVIIQADWSAAIAKTNQHQTVSRSMTLYTNTTTTITARPGLNNGVLTLGTHTLDTAYKLTGAVTPADPQFKPATQFFNSQNVYTVTHTPGTGAYPITLEAQITSPPDSTPENGVYECGLTLTAVW